MIFKPAQLGMAKLDQQELVEDRKSCKKIGPCGVGKKALVCIMPYLLFPEE